MSAIPISDEQAKVDRYVATFALSGAAMTGIKITPAQLAAGRAAFKRKRRLLDDLWQAFDCDIDAAVRHIYREMVRAGL